jgi:hypothetical protein
MKDKWIEIFVWGIVAIVVYEAIVQFGRAGTQPKSVAPATGGLASFLPSLTSALGGIGGLPVSFNTNTLAPLGNLSQGASNYVLNTASNFANTGSTTSSGYDFLGASSLGDLGGM